MKIDLDYNINNMETRVDNKCKAFTSLEQSRKLADILPLESADMCWQKIHDENHMISDYRVELIPYRLYGGIGVPCWSLAALLDILPFPQLSKDKLGSGKVGWMVSVYPNDCRYDSCWHNNPIDSCYEMILKLHD